MVFFNSLISAFLLQMLLIQRLLVLLKEKAVNFIDYLEANNNFMVSLFM